MADRFTPAPSPDRDNEAVKEHPLLARHEVSCHADLHCRYQPESRSGAGETPLCRHDRGAPR